MTNFERITESPDKLAEFLYELDFSCTICPMSETCGRDDVGGGCGKVILEWLKEESGDGDFVDELSEAVDEVIEGYPNALEMLGKD